MAQKKHADTTEKKYFAAIDLGSRNCRLLVAKKVGKKLEPQEALSRFVCLGEGVAKSQKLSKDAMDRAITALSQCVKKMNVYAPQSFLAVATAATRSASNGQFFLNRVQDEVGLQLNIISCEEEAYYAVLGCHELVKPETDFAIIFDIGGGSTELILADCRTGAFPKVIDVTSIPMGVVSLSEDSAHTTFKYYSGTVKKVLEQTQSFYDRNNIDELTKNHAVQLVGTSGTTTTVAALHQNLKFYDRDKVDGTTLTFENVQAVIKHVQLMDQEERLIHPCIGQAKDDLILGGLAIFEGIYTALSDLSVTVTDRGVRDGIVHSLAHQHANQA